MGEWDTPQWGLLWVPVIGIAVLALVLVAAAMVLRRESRRTVPSGPASRVPLEVHGVGARIGGRTVLAGVDLTVPPGAVVAILGPNGAGKSTLLRIISGLDRAVDGEVRVFGHRVEASSPVLRHVGIAVGRPGVHPHCTGREHLRLVWAATGRPAAEAGFAGAEEFSGLGEALDRKAGGYSEGMRQSLALATALLGTPDVLVLDEPTNALDPFRAEQVRHALRRYAATGRSVLITTHNLDEAECLCDEVVVMAGGRIVLRRGHDGPDTAAHADRIPAERPGTGDGSERTLRVATSDNEAASVLLAGVSGMSVLDGHGMELQVRARGDGLARGLESLREAGIAVWRVRPLSDLERGYHRVLAEHYRPGSGADEREAR